jgi:hypothetical protein
MYFAGLGYIGQTALNHGHDEEAMNERLSLENIAKSSFQRAGFSSLIPAGVDFTRGTLGYDPYYKFGRNSTLANSAIMGTPSISWANQAQGTANNIAQTMVGKDDFMWTKGEAKDAATLFLPNIYGLRSLIDMWAGQFPAHNHLKEYEPQQ